MGRSDDGGREMIIKHIPEDFIVQEVLVTDHASQYTGQEYILLNLDKKGFSTFDALAIIKNRFEIDACTAAGLKDSDGVTSQKIGIPSRFLDRITRIDEFNREHTEDNRFIHLTLLGYTDVPIQPTRLEGNVFRLRLRDMDTARAEKMMEKKIYTLIYPNYFDKQRFGIPGHKKVSHLIGEALYDKDYRKAYEYLQELGTKEASLPFDGDYEQFFNQIIDQNIRHFYDSSLYSADFNDRLGNILEQDGPVCVLEDEGITFRMPTEKRTMARLLQEDFPEEEIGAFRVMTLEQKVPRKLLTTTNINFLGCEKDKYFPGKSVLTISFFLPMGSYATMAMKQLDIFSRGF